MLEIEPLPQKFIEILNEDPEQLERDVETLRDWLLKQPHLCIRNDDQFLVNVIRGCKYRLEKAKRKISTYCTARAKLPELFDERNVNNSRIHEILKLGVFVPLNIKSLHTRILIYRFEAYDPMKCDLHEIFKIIGLLSDIFGKEDNLLFVTGYREIIDMNNFTVSHAAQFEPALLKRLVNYFQDGLPVSMRDIHIMNASPLFEYFINFVKQFLSKKIQSRIKIHNSLEALHEVIPKEMLPLEYGGEAGAISEIVEKWSEILKKSEDFITEANKYGVDKSKCTDDTFSHEDTYGPDGSFRKLTID